MAIELNNVELDITKEIINIGLSKAADSLSFFIKEKVLIQVIDLKVNEKDYSPFSKKDGNEKSYLLTTNIKGDFQGNAYLIFNELEADKVLDVNLPASIKNNPVEKAKMTDAFLLEIDNIITASVITQFSNILQSKIYGDVPALKILPHNDIDQFLSEKNSFELNVIYFNSRFITKEVNINPEFIWLLDDKFFNSVKNLVSDAKKIELLKKLKETSLDA